MKFLFFGARLFDDVYFYLKEKNIYSILTDSNPDAINLDLADEYHIVSRGIEGPLKIAIENNVDAIIPLIGIDTPLIQIAILKEIFEKEYDIPVISSNFDVINITSDKIKTKEFFTKNSILTPSYKVINKKNLINFSNFPLVLKQAEGQGGKDIKVCNDVEDAFEYLNNFDLALSEEFIEGSEISVEVLGYKNDYVALTPIYKGETSLKGIHPLNKIKHGPFKSEHIENSEIKSIALKIAKNLGAEGITEIDFILSSKDHKLYALEVNNRPNGTRYLTSATCDVNTILSLVDMASGEFSSLKTKKAIKEFSSCEIPIGTFTGKKGDIKSFKNNDFIVHGPPGFERITLRANSEEELNSLIKKLNLEKYFITPKKILFIGSRLFDDVDYYLNENNIYSILTDSNPDALNLDLADEYHIVSRGMEEPLKIAIENNVDAVVPLIGVDSPLLEIAKLKDILEKKYNIPVISSNIDVINITNDKFKSKKFFKENSILTPNYRKIVKNDLNLSFNYPLVLKQAEGQGGQDMIICHNLDELTNYLNKYGEALAEEFIEGSELSVEVLGYNNEYIALSPIYKGETCNDLIHPIHKFKSGPFKSEYIENSEILENSIKIAKNLGAEGITEIDYVLSSKDHKLYAFEVNNRPNANRYSTIATCNVSSLLKVIDMAIGKFSIKDIKESMKYSNAYEMPVSNYNGPIIDVPDKSFRNKDYIIHGLPTHERITLKYDNDEDLNKLIKKLNLEKYIE